MELVLEVTSGPEKGRQLKLRPQELRQVGSGLADLVLRRDPAMAAIHFDLLCENDAGRLRHLSGGSTVVNGQKVNGTITVRDGDQITAGLTRFVVRVDGAGHPAPGNPPHTSGAEHAVSTATV